MASMVFASSPLSAQSLVKLRPNSKYPRSSCYVPSYFKANSYNVHLSYKISHIESSKSSFTTGDGFSKFPLLKFPRVASTLSPSLNIIKASSIYDLKSNTLKLQKNHLSEYKGRVLLIVNIPLQGLKSSKINYFNELRKGILRDHKNGFEVLGFIYDKKELGEKSKEERTEAQILNILDEVTFPIFKTDELNKEIEEIGKPPKASADDPLKEDVRNFLTKFNEDEILLVNREGIPELFPWFDEIDSQSVQSGPGLKPPSAPTIDPIKDKIEEYF